MNERNYSVADLIHDESFRRLAKGGASPEEIERWNQWIEESEENRRKAKRARSEIAGFELAGPTVTDFEKAWFRLYSSTLGKKSLHPIKSAHKDSSLRWIYRVAAAFLLVGMVGMGFYLNSENDRSTHLEQIIQEETVTTGVGQQKILKFNKGTKVAKIVLNSKSSLTFNVGLLQDQAVKVTLQGEAFFDVERGFSEGHPAFSITTPDGVIEDRGTEFLVTVENDRSAVVLQEGLVNVKTGDRERTLREFQVHIGELVEFSKTNILKKETVNSTFYTSWATGSMRFDKTEIDAFAEYVERRFGVNVQLADTGLADVTLDGAVYFKSLEGLVRSVSEVTGIPVYQSADRDTVYIGDMNYTNN